MQTSQTDGAYTSHQHHVISNHDDDDDNNNNNNDDGDDDVGYLCTSTTTIQFLSNRTVVTFTFKMRTDRL